MIVFFPSFLFFCSCEKEEPPKAKEKEKEQKYYYYEYKEGTVRCHFESNNIVTCLSVID